MPSNKLNGLLLDCSYKLNEKEEAVIQLYISTEKEIKYVEDLEFKPYFYVLSKNPLKTIEALKEHDFGEGIKVLKSEIVEKNNSKNVLKVFFKNPQYLVRARETIELVEGVIEKREYDIPFTDRYLIDNSLKPMSSVEIEEENGIVKKTKPIEKDNHEMRIVALDLETYSPGRFSDPKQDPILMCVLSTSKDSKVYTYKETKAKNTVVVANETELIEKVLSDLREFQPDILVTYNGDSFDLPYLKTRCEKLKIKCDFGFGGVRVVRRGMFNAAKLKGTQHLDAYQLLRFMARIGAVNLLKLDLENVSLKLFGIEKEKLAHTKINELWDEGNIDNIVEYNREDGEVTLKISQDFLALQLELSTMLQNTLYDTSRASSSQMVEKLLIINSFKKNNLIPNKPLESEVNQRMLQTFKGGYVKAPVPGLHQNIAVLDFRSLHPTIMISHNISPDTLKCTHSFLFCAIWIPY